MSARRDWFAVYCRLVRLSKFRRLSDDAQLALFYVWAIAGDETPEATWRTADDLALALQLHGRNPVTIGDTIEELRRAGWLDALEDGSVTAHDWDDWQIAATTEARRVWEARYMRDWRRRKREEREAATTPSPLDSSPPSTGHHNTGQYRGEQPVNNTWTTGNAGRDEPGRNGADRTTCPRCGDLLDDKDPNVVVADRGHQLWHRACPGIGATA